ncbi:unnamed protein product [Moneuplotes crassus]|uniref:Uncharacterized protein n=1 Tax=Euplotes crassus TaxID=5936 RepID=A0AAD1Y2Q8_EUPCR|nr:unnamed protein product [Moneuplotes crassus]
MAKLCDYIFILKKSRWRLLIREVFEVLDGNEFLIKAKYEGFFYRQDRIYDGNIHLYMPYLLHFN